MRWVFTLFTLVLVAICTVSQASTGSSGPTILSGPTFTNAQNAPLAGTLQVSTDVDSRVGVLVSDGTNVWQKDFYDFSTNHSEILLGFKPSRTNLIQVTVYDQNQGATTAPQILTFVSPALPASFPPSTVLQSQPDLMEPGYTLFIVENRSSAGTYVTMMDNSGQVVWYCPSPASFDDDVLQLDNGDLLITDTGNKLVELNMLGATVRTWPGPPGYPFDIHGAVPTEHGTILYLTDVTNSVANFPSSTASNAPLKTVNVINNPAVEISYDTGTVLNTWQVQNLLNPTRISYLTYDEGVNVADNEHANAIIEDTNDNSIIVSMRNQNAVIKFSRDGTLKWILGPPANWGPSFQQYLFTPVGTPFAWNYAEHAPMLTTEGTLLLYDDGNYRASPQDPPVADKNNYSRAVEFSLDTTNMQVKQVWDSSLAAEDRLYTPSVGKAQWLPERRNVLATYGNVTFVNGLAPSSHSASAAMVRIVEYTHDPIPQVVFDLSLFDYTNTSPSYRGCFVYRATRVPDLYTHPAIPVADCSLQTGNGTAALQFSADPERSYVVQASTDLVNWTTVGSASEDGGAGEYEFDDLNARQYPSRFYRVVTQ